MICFYQSAVHICRDDLPIQHCISLQSLLLPYLRNSRLPCTIIQGTLIAKILIFRNKLTKHLKTCINFIDLHGCMCCRLCFRIFSWLINLPARFKLSEASSSTFVTTPPVTTDIERTAATKMMLTVPSVTS